jgi:hypothetical protein
VTTQQWSILFIINGRQFVFSEGLKKIQEIKTEPGSKLREYIDEINSLYPCEIVQYYTPGYEQCLLKKLYESYAGLWGILQEKSQLEKL